MAWLPRKLHGQLDLPIVLDTGLVGLISGLAESDLHPAIGRPALFVTMNPLRVFVTSAQMSARIRAPAAVPWASGLVHISNHRVSRHRNLRRTRWAGPDLNAPREIQTLRELLARAGSSR